MVGATLYRPLELSGSILGLISCIGLIACETQITETPVPVARVEITAPLTTLMVGQIVQLAAVPRSSDGDGLSARPVTWSSSDASVADVNTSGQVTALSAGIATIRAASGGVSGQVELVVTAPPQIALATSSVSFNAVAGAADPAPQTVAITNDGGGVLSGLSLGVIQYTSGQAGWLTATLDRTTASATLTLRATSQGLSAGIYSAIVAIAASLAANTPQTVTVQLTVQGASTWTSLAVGLNHACGTIGGGEIYCWGSNAEGQLGDATTVSRLTPTKVSGGLLFATGSLTARWAHTCGLTAGREAYCWGSNSMGQLGDATTTIRRAPTKVVGGLDFAEASLATGFDFSCGTTTSGDTYCWGSNNDGQLGDGTTTHRLTPSRVAGALTFVGGSPDAGHNHTCGTTAAGEAYCWGLNHVGQLGDGSTTSRHTPTKVSGGVVFAPGSIVAGRAHTCGLTVTSEAYCWGHNNNSELGDGSTTQRFAPIRVAGGLVFAQRSLASGRNHTCGVMSTGEAYCWGSNSSGQLGDGTTTYPLTPVKVSGGLVFSARSLAAGGEQTCGITTVGEAYCWGSNDSGQLGDGSTTDRLTPVRVRDP